MALQRHTLLDFGSSRIAVALFMTGHWRVKLICGMLTRSGPLRRQRADPTRLGNCGGDIVRCYDRVSEKIMREQCLRGICDSQLGSGTSSLRSISSAVSIGTGVASTAGDSVSGGRPPPSSQSERGGLEVGSDMVSATILNVV